MWACNGRGVGLKGIRRGGGEKWGSGCKGKREEKASTENKFLTVSLKELDNGKCY